MPRHNGNTRRIRDRNRRHWMLVRGLTDRSEKDQDRVAGHPAPNEKGEFNYER